jgi:hypothetical protein
MDAVSREDIQDLRHSIDGLRGEVLQLTGLVREEIGRCSACRPMVLEHDRYIHVDCDIRSNGSAGGLDSIIRSHEETIQTVRRTVLWAFGAAATSIASGISAIAAWMWQRP